MIQAMITATTKLAKLGLILMGSNYVAFWFGKIVPEVQSAVQKKNLCHWSGIVNFSHQKPTA